MLVCLLAIATFFVLVMAADCNRFVIRTYRCRVGQLKKDAKVVLLSDLHGKSFGKENEKLLSAIEKTCPDMIWIAGDMYTSSKEGDTQTARGLVLKLAERYPVFYANGNHEQKTKERPEDFGEMYPDYADSIEKAKVRHLVNEKITLPEYNMDIYGTEIGFEYYGKFNFRKMEPDYLEGLLGKPDRSRATMLIAHNPDYFRAYADWGADLVVSGHIHGGLMRFPVLGGAISPSLKLFPEYDGGEFKKGKATMILSRGLGTHTLPIRIFNPGELVVIELTDK